MTPELAADLGSVLEESQRLGFIGPGSIQPHIDRSLAMARLLSSQLTYAMDMGSGGGLPGLVLALATPSVRWVLLDGSVRRCAFLTEAVSQLSLGDRVSVVAGRAEEAGRGPLRATFDAVVSRSFGPPATTAECAAPFLRERGNLIVAEPPGGADRWPAHPLVQLGLRPVVAQIYAPSDGGAFQVLEQFSLCPDRYPRRVGVPAKRPLF